MNKSIAKILSAFILILIIIGGCTKKENLSGPTAAPTAIHDNKMQATMVPTTTGPAKFYGGAVSTTANTIINTSDGGFAFTGTNSTGSGYLVKTDGAGNILWQQVYLTDTFGLVQTPDAGFLIANGNGTTKVDATGVIQNTYNYYSANPSFYDLEYITDAPGGYVVFDQNFMMIKVDLAGNSLWAYSYTPTGGGYMNGFSKTSSGGFLLTGVVYNGTYAAYDIHCVKTDSAGTVIFANDYGTSAEDYSYGVLETGTSNVIFGYTNSIPGQKYYFIKTNSAGNITFSNIFGEDFSNVAYSACDIKDAGDGNYIALGSEITHFDIAPYYIENTNVMKIDSTGQVLWSKYFYNTSAIGTYYNIPNICIAPDNGIVISGTTINPATGYLNCFLMKIDASGNRVW